MTENQEPLSLAQMERAERKQRLTVDDYARMMLTMIHEQAPMDVEDVRKRLPDELKENSALVALAEVANSLTEKSFSKVHTQWKNIPFSATLTDLATEVSKRLRYFGLEHVRRVYSVISVDRFSALTGLNDDLSAARTYAVDAGFVFDPLTKFISVIPLLPDESMDDGDWGADLDGLGLISDTVWALSRQSNPTNENLVKRMHDY